VTYTSANTPFNSDSFPGLLALVTGGSAVSHDVFYDVGYDRSAFGADNVNCSGAPGSVVTFDESVDRYRVDATTKLPVSEDVLDTTALPRRRDASHRCVPFYPHELLRINTVFELVKSYRGRTAWIDKHPVYEVVNGPSGKGVDDLYTPEMTHTNGFDNRTSVVCTVQNDALKVKALLNQIHGRSHDGAARVGVPVLFGMNFQAVSVGQKLAREAEASGCKATDEASLAGQSGGYLDGAGTPTPVLQYGLDQTDQALGAIVDALRSEHLYESTLVIITAKHGQSPINPATLSKPGHFAKLVAALPDAATDPAAAAVAKAALCHSGPCGFIQDDDVAMLWLPDQSQTAQVARYLSANAQPLHIANVLAGASLQLSLNDPATSSRTPDIIVVPLYGVIYTNAASKNAEHGGLNYSDTNVGLIVSNPRLPRSTVKRPVLSSQVAPTILEALGIDPHLLGAVQRELTPVLPGLRAETQLPTKTIIGAL
jgi:hypothetical protein